MIKKKWMTIQSTTKLVGYIISSGCGSLERIRTHHGESRYDNDSGLKLGFNLKIDTHKNLY